ncbi:MAG TPA: hypothetical protein VMT76_08180 [Puia sp.]|nr:hypothetical protein [Puia sp.]
MRTITVFTVIFFSITVKAQMPLTTGFMNYPLNSITRSHYLSLDTSGTKKWFFSKYIGLSTGAFFFNGAASAFIAAPLGLQLNRMLNNNFVAFAGVSATPVYSSFNHSFLYSDVNKTYPNSFYNVNNIGIYPSAQMGLMYVNNARTFSISGSISVQRGSSPVYAPINSGKRTSAAVNR